jgi:serine/threonine protein kinase
LGTGQFGEVSHGIYEGKNVALKVNMSHLSYDKEFIEFIKFLKSKQKLKENVVDSERNQLEQEAKILNRCKHDNLVKIIGACYRNDLLHVIVMEYMNSGDLLSYLKKPIFVKQYKIVFNF